LILLTKSMIFFGLIHTYLVYGGFIKEGYGLTINIYNIIFIL
jgi:hypothetical protein